MKIDMKQKIFYFIEHRPARLKQNSLTKHIKITTIIIHLYTNNEITNGKGII